MRLSPRSPHFFCCLAAVLCLIAFANVASAQTTTITGKVYSPYGPGVGDPIPNILVYVAQSPVLPFSSTVGQGVTGGCTAQANLVSGNPLVSALTAADGSFTLSSSSIPSSANIVIQAGKWRRQYQNTPITVGSITNLNLTMPASQIAGVADLPHIAIVTGEVDAVECIFHQIGIADSEFTNPDGSGSINLYKGAVDGGAVITASTSSDPTPGEAALVSSPATLASYDVVMFGCQGTPTQPLATASPYPNANQTNLINFANAGGRVFATHYEYVWLDTDQPFESAATWGGNTALGTQIATIDQTYPEGAILAQWIQNVGASYNNTLGQIQLQNTEVNTVAVNNPPAQSWVKLNDPTYNNPSMQFTFNTPVGSAGIPTVAITYSNSTTTFLQGTPASVTINATNNSTTAADDTLTLSIALPGGLTATSLMGVGNTGWTCTLTPLTCSRVASGLPLTAGATDAVTLAFNIASTASVGQASITSSLSGGGLSGTNQCGRVLYNDYHVENTSVRANTIYPAECQGLPGTAAGTATAQEKFLEFSLYNLSNFVSPSTTDLITIQGQTVLAWTPNPLATITYGTILTTTQLDASATDAGTGSPIPGTYAYSYSGGTITAGTVLPAGTYTLYVTFTPTDSVDYSSASATNTITVNTVPTTTQITSLLPSIYYGQIIGYTGSNAIAGSSAPACAAGVYTCGNILVYVDGLLVCTLPNTTYPTQQMCPNTGFEGQAAGAHTIYAVYTGDTDYASSTSPIYPVQVLPDTTLTTLSSSSLTVTPTQAVTLTANVSVITPSATAPAAAASGTVTFLDGTTPIGTQTITNGSVATLTLPNFLTGLHNITACFATGVNSLGNYNFIPTCSAAVVEVVTFPPTITPTTALLTSSENPSTVGQSVTFTATIATTGAFIGVPTGTVTFFDGPNSIGTAILDTSGNGTFSISTLTAGLHSITAVYAGNATTSGSTSPIVAQLVNTSLISAGTGFLLTVTPTTFSVGAGSSVALSVEVTELNNFNTPVNLSCSGLPSEATCTFASSTIPATGGTTILFVSPAAPHDCGSNTPYFVAQGGRTGLPIFAAITLIFFARKRRALKGLVLAALICLIPAISGCGGNCTDLGVKPGTYTFTVTGTSVPGNTVTTGSSTPVTHSQTMTMTVTI